MINVGLKTRIRTHRMASPTRAGSWARAKARREQRRWLRRRWRQLTIAAGIWVALVIALAALMPQELVRGIIVGAGLVGGPLAVWTLVVQVTGTAPTMMGDVAEQWTAQELRPLTRRGWRLINHAGLATDDIDHFLVGPGGAFVLETKWSSALWDSSYGLGVQRSAARQVGRNAVRMTNWSTFRPMRLEVRPVVVLWGGEAQGTSSAAKPVEAQTGGDRSIDGATILRGAELRGWIEKQRSEVSTETLNDVWPRVLDHAAGRDAVERSVSPMPMSGLDLLLTGVFSLTAASMAALLIVELLRRTNSWSVTAMLAVPVILAGVFVARWRPVRLLALAWTAGGTLATLAILVVVASQFLHPLT